MGTALPRYFADRGRLSVIPAIALYRGPPRYVLVGMRKGAVLCLIRVTPHSRQLVMAAPPMAFANSLGWADIPYWKASTIKAINGSRMIKWLAIG